MLLLLDNFDSFTYNLQDYLAQLGKECKVFRNDVSLQEITSYNYEGVVLSPGPEKPSDAGNLMEVLRYYHLSKPILGVCLGHQAIAEFFGGEVYKAKRPFHGKLSTIYHNQKGLFDGLTEQFDVVRYNSLLVNIKNVDVLQGTAYTIDGNELMALRHKELSIKGVQFHPEAIKTEFGIDILKNWISNDLV